MTLPLDQRREILQKEINKYLRQGYRVLSQTDTTAQLVRPKRFSCLAATLWMLLLIVGLFIYIFMYMAKKDDTVYITVDENGRVKTKKG